MLPRIYLCWFPVVSRPRVHALQTITELINDANARLPAALAKSMRLNWMVNDISQNGMLKPIVVNNDWQTIVGDTRLMALDVLQRSQVPVLAQLAQPEGQVITSEQELFEHCAVHGVCVHDQSSVYTQPVDWVDFDMPESQDHWHDPVQRLDLMQRYLDHQCHDFKFDLAWFKSPVNWTQWSI